MKGRSLWAAMALVLIAVATVLSPIEIRFGDDEEKFSPGVYPVDALAWSSLNELKGIWITGGFSVNVADTMVRFESDGSGWSTDGVGTTRVRWWFYSVSELCTVEVYTPDCPADSNKFITLASATSGGGSGIIPGLKNGVDSVRFRGTASLDVAVWGVQ